jgi:hypothetical protein
MSTGVRDTLGKRRGKRLRERANPFSDSAGASLRLSAVGAKAEEGVHFLDGQPEELQA